MFNRKYIFQRSIFPLLCLGEGTGFCAGYFVFATVFFKWKGSTKACQVGVPLHLVLKEGEAFVPPNFWWIFWNWKMGLRKTCTQKRRGLLFHFRSRGTTPGFFVCDSSSPHSYREVSSLSDLYIYIYTYVCTVYFMYLSLSLSMYTHIFSPCWQRISNHHACWKVAAFAVEVLRGQVRLGWAMPEAVGKPGEGKVHIPIHNTVGGTWWIIPNRNNLGGEEETKVFLLIYVKGLLYYYLFTNRHPTILVWLPTAIASLFLRDLFRLR